MTTKNEGTQRDELATLIVCEAYRRRGFAELTTPPAQQDRELADAILAAGYRKPRTITTVEELDALPDGAVIVDADKNAYTALKRADGTNWWNAALTYADGTAIALPATVLHEPKAEAAQ